MNSFKEPKTILDAKIIFVVTNPITAVVRSQIFENITSLRKAGIETDVIFLLQTKHFFKSRNIRPDDLSVIGARSSIKLLPFQHSKLSQFIGALILLWRTYSTRSKKVIFHCRGTRSTAIALRASKLTKMSSVIFDVRGDLLAETEFLSGSDEKLKELSALEYKCIIESNHTLYVSEYLRKTVTERHGISNDNSSVMYCTASRDRLQFHSNIRIEMRKKLGIKDEITFIYTGSIGLWHCFDTVIFICEILAGIYKNARFLFLVNQPEAAKTSVSQSNIAAITDVFSAIGDEIGAYLSSADVSLLIREPHPLNYAASPVKFAEYVMNGLPVIMTDAIRDYAKMIQDYGNGIVLNANKCSDEAYIEAIFSDISTDKWLNLRNCYPDSITNNLSKENYVEKLCNLYKNIM